MSASRPAGLLLGVAADAVFGDPPRAHPVAAFGTVASQAERLLYRDQRAVGAVYVGVLVGGATGAGVLMQRMCRQRTIEIAATAVTTWAVLGATSLAGESLAMARALEASEIRAARDRLGHLCGRAADQLDAPGLARATVESVAENTSDAIVAPLFWGAVAGIPGLVAYRAVNTLDAMVGRRSRRYRRFGWAAAHLDDVANFVPARACAALTVLCAPLVGGSSRRAWRTWREDASAHPSPNAGQVEAAFAGALRIRLGGRTVYHHASEERPVMGRGRSADTRDVARSVALSRMLVVLSGFAAVGVALLVGRRR